MCAFYLSDVSRGREPNRRLAFGKRLRFLALCSVSILADTLCRFAIYLKTALCRAAPLTSHFVRQRPFDIANESVPRGREPNRRLAFGGCLQTLALCSVSILAGPLCRLVVNLRNREPRGILCTRGEKEYASIRQQTTACDNRLVKNEAYDESPRKFICAEDVDGQKVTLTGLLGIGQF